jgi:hypothetical protein
MLRINADEPLIKLLQTTITSQRIRTPIASLLMVSLRQDG